MIIILAQAEKKICNVLDIFSFFPYAAMYG